MPTVPDSQRTFVPPGRIFVEEPEPQRGLTMMLARWLRLKERIRKCKRPLSYWSVPASAFIGAALTSAIPAWNDLTIHPSKITASILVLAISVVGSFGCWGAYYEASGREVDSIDSIVDEMKEIDLLFRSKE